MIDGRWSQSGEPLLIFFFSSDSGCVFDKIYMKLNLHLLNTLLFYFSCDCVHRDLQQALSLFILVIWNVLFNGAMFD